MRREICDWVLSQGAEAFDSGYTCLSCERPYSPWLAGIPEQRQRETEKVECERLRVKRILAVKQTTKRETSGKESCLSGRKENKGLS